MRKSTSIPGIILCLLFLIIPSPQLHAADTPEKLTASISYIPPLAENPDKGPFVDLVKAIGKELGIDIKIGVFPGARSVDNMEKGRADFHMPTMRIPSVDESKLPYKFIAEKFGTVTFVIYSNTGKTITKDIINAAKNKKPFPYTVESPAGLENLFDFPCNPSNDISLSLQKVQKGRIDAFIWAQEEADFTIKNLKLNLIHREPWQTFDDSIIVAKGPHGDKVDAMLSSAILKMKKSGRLEKLYEKIHRPYYEWQPADMGW